MKNYIKELLSKPYNLLESNKFRYIYVFGGAGFAFLFLWIFEPFKLYNLGNIDKFISLALYIGGAFPGIILQFFFFQNKLIKTYTIGINIFWLALSFFLIGSSVFFVHVFLFKNGIFYFFDFIFFQGVILAINIIPTSITILIHYNYLINSRLKKVAKINNNIINKPNNLQKDKIITLKSQYKNDMLELSLDSLFYITSADNYINVCYKDAQSIKHKLLRSSLSEITKSFNGQPELLRCHKSYIINKTKIESLTGNAAGYKIKLKSYSELIPVSRNLNKSIQEIINI